MVNNTNNKHLTDSIMVAEHPVDQIHSLVQDLASKLQVLEDNVRFFSREMQDHKADGQLATLLDSKTDVIIATLDSRIDRLQKNLDDHVDKNNQNLDLMFGRIEEKHTGERA